MEAPIPEDGSYRLIPLTKGQFAKVDTADFDWINQWKWNATRQKRTEQYYATRGVRIGRKGTSVQMQRLILGLEPGDPRVADHINRSETLDNRRANLRIATPQQNRWNSRRRIDNQTTFKGVYKNAKKYAAKIRLPDRTDKHLGTFDDAESAYKAYCDAAKTHFGDFAHLE